MIADADEGIVGDDVGKHAQLEEGSYFPAIEINPCWRRLNVRSRTGAIPYAPAIKDVVKIIQRDALPHREHAILITLDAVPVKVFNVIFRYYFC